MNQMTLGLGARARVGKDYLADYVIKQMAVDYPEVKVRRYSFAGALKNELDEFLLKNFNISAWTQDPVLKEFIRPMLVTYGMMWRKLDPDHWIKVVESSMKRHQETDGKALVFNIITDVRFSNEAVWVKNLSENSTLICISAPVECNNDIEAVNHVIVDTMADTVVHNNLKDASMCIEVWRILSEKLDTMVETYIKEVL